MRNNLINKLAVLFFVLTLSLLAALGWASRVAGGCKGLYMVSVKNQGGKGYPAEAASGAIDDGLLASYEVIGEKRVKAINAFHDAVFVGTNYAYPFVMRLNMKSGGFFTEADGENRARAAVLNEKAAFAMFGNEDIVGLGFECDGETYFVRGVISDGDAGNLNIYAPSGALPGIAGVNAVVCATGGLGEENVINTLKQNGITPQQSHLINLGAVADAVSGRFEAALLALLAIIAVLAFIRVGLALFSQVKEIRAGLRQSYFSEWTRQNLGKAAALALLAALAATAAFIAAASAFRIFGLSLEWQTYSGALSGVPVSGFAGKPEAVKQADAVSRALFAAFAPVAALTAGLVLARRSDS